MLRPILKTIEIQGFRSFGGDRQSAHIQAPIAVFWGPNSKGKTSFAEAIEFLLTGQTVKREVLSSRADEFADALRHAHLDSDAEVYASATVECQDGSVRLIKRTLTRDYAKQGDCETALTIDGVPAQETDLLALGIVLAQAPLRAPVLSQHVLNYIFTVRPADRSAYFKALLEVTDLDDFRRDAGALEYALAPPGDPLLTKLEKVKSIPLAALHFLVEDLTGVDTLRKAFSLAATAILAADEIATPTAFDGQIAGVEAYLREKRAKAFPTHLFGRKTFQGYSAPDEDDWSKLSAYVHEKSKVDEQARSLTGLFKTLLNLPGVANTRGPQDCPVCETEGGLTPERIELIRANVASNESFVMAEAAALSLMQRLQTNASAVEQSARSALPKFLADGATARRAAGFTLARMKPLVSGDVTGLVPSWLKAVCPLQRAYRLLSSRCAAAHKVLGDLITSPGELQAVSAIKNALSAVESAGSVFSAAEAIYRAAEKPLFVALNAAIDNQGSTAGWQELIELARDLPALRASVVEQIVRATAKQELQAALKQIDKGIEEVLDKKFSLLSKSVENWWSLLRGGEPTFFSAVQRRGKITIDFKGGLSRNPDQSNPKIRDVIAVFSDSQLHCLGLALFLARAQHYGASFVVLDDPVLTSDEDYRVHFRGRVIARLHELGIQTIVLTQQQGLRRDIASTNEHLGVDQFQIDIPDPSKGSVVTKTSDEFDAMLSRAVAYTISDDLEIRRDGGKKLRDATERFCKKLLVRKRRDGGDGTAVVSDYDGQMLGGAGGLVQQVTPYLNTDPSHPGKLVTICSDLNPPAHDDDGVPTRQALKEALGNLRRFRKDYLA